MNECRKRELLDSILGVCRRPHLRVCWSIRTHKGIKVKKNILNHLVKEPFGAAAARELCRGGGVFEPGRLYRRLEISDALRGAFVEHGGAAGTTRARVAQVLKKWLVGSASPFRKEARGLYRFLGREADAARYLGAAVPSIAANAVNDASLDVGLTPEREIGTGPCEVHAWCLPRYVTACDGRWPIKVGSAGAEGFARALLDFLDNLPERPRYLLRLGCADETEALRREMLLHAWFTSRGQQVDGAPGNGWFHTNPGEVEQAARNLVATDNPGRGAGAAEPEDLIAAAFKEVAHDDWAQLPEDLTDRLDEYLYGGLIQ